MYGVTVAPMLREGIPKAHNITMGIRRIIDFRMMLHTIVRESPKAYEPRTAVVYAFGPFLSAIAPRSTLPKVLHTRTKLLTVAAQGSPLGKQEISPLFRSSQ